MGLRDKPRCTFPGRIILALWAGLWAVSARAATWYIAPTGSGGNDANPGTLAQPFYTFYPAIALAQPGDTLYARGGLYPYPTTQWFSCSGTASAWITISAYPGETPIVDGSSMPVTDYALGLGGEYLVLQGFTIQNAPNGIDSWETGHLRILNNTIKYSKAWGIACGAATIGNATDILIDGNQVFQNDQSNNPPCQNCGWPAAITTYWAKGVTVSHNLSYNNYGEGFAISHSEDISVLHNTSFDNYSVEIYMDNAQFCTIGGNRAFSTFNMNFYRFGYPAMGIACANEDYAAPHPLTDDVIVDNVVFNCRFGFDYGNFMSGGGMRNFIVANNTFYGALDTLLQIDPDAGHTHNLVVNNVFDQVGGGNLASVGAPLSAFTFSHNAWTGGSPGALAGPGDVLAPPQLVNPGSAQATGYGPQAGSPLLDAGMTVGIVTEDYLGVSRPQGPAYDIGAFEIQVPTPKAVPSPTPTPTGTPGNGWTPIPTPDLQVDLPWPNPWNGSGDLSLYHDLTTPADDVSLILSTVGFRRVLRVDHLPTEAGLHLIRLEGSRLGSLANGLYYLTVEETRDGRIGRKSMKLLVLR